MATDDLVKLLISMGSGLLGGLIVALVNHFVTRHKTQAETEKLIAETKRINLEIQKMSTEVGGISSTVQEVKDKLIQVNEKIIYDGITYCDGADFIGKEDRLYGEPKEKLKGTGTLKVENGILNLQRTNTDGRYRITLVRYLYEGMERDYLPKNDLLAGRRVLKLTCEVKAGRGEHSLNFLIKKKESGDWLGEHKQVFTQNEWTQVIAYFRISPNENCQLWLDNYKVSRPDASIQLRKIVLAERVSQI
jgi:hypothetical protein